MKKSMIATAVVATAGLAASANAGYWTISGANYVNGGTNNIAVSNLQNQVNTYVSSTFSGSASGSTMSNTDASMSAICGSAFSDCSSTTSAVPDDSRSCCVIS